MHITPELKVRIEELLIMIIGYTPTHIRTVKEVVIDCISNHEAVTEDDIKKLPEEQRLGLTAGHTLKGWLLEEEIDKSIDFLIGRWMIQVTGEGFLSTKIN